MAKGSKSVADRTWDNRTSSLEKEIDSRTRSSGRDRNEVRTEVYKEQADRDKRYDEYVRSTWGS